MSFTPKNGERHWHCTACQKDYRTRYGLVMHKVRAGCNGPCYKKRKLRRGKR